MIIGGSVFQLCTICQAGADPSNQFWSSKVQPSHCCLCFLFSFSLHLCVCLCVRVVPVECGVGGLFCPFFGEPASGRCTCYAIMQWMDGMDAIQCKVPAIQPSFTRFALLCLFFFVCKLSCVSKNLPTTSPSSCAASCQERKPGVHVILTTGRGDSRIDRRRPLYFQISIHAMRHL